MALDFTGILITLDDVKARSGSPSTSPNSQFNVPDQLFQNIIDLKQAVVTEMVERKMESLSNEQILNMDLKFDKVSVSTVGGNYVAVGTIDTEYLPCLYRCVNSTGIHLNVDDDIDGTGFLNTGTGVEKYRYFVDGDDLKVLPNTTSTITIHLPTKDEVRQVLLSEMIDSVNTEIVRESRQMVRERVGVTSGFKNEAINEGP